MNNIRWIVNTLLQSLGAEQRFAQPEKGHVRAGYTTNKGRGQSKTRRKMAKQSRRINRR